MKAESRKLYCDSINLNINPQYFAFRLNSWKLILALIDVSAEMNVAGRNLNYRKSSIKLWYVVKSSWSQSRQHFVLSEWAWSLGCSPNCSPEGKHGSLFLDFTSDQLLQVLDTDWFFMRTLIWTIKHSPLSLSMKRIIAILSRIKIQTCGKYLPYSYLFYIHAPMCSSCTFPLLL